MGEIADMLFDLAIQQMAEYDEMIEELEKEAKAVARKYKNGTATWITKGGKKIKVTDMEESHIKNCINMLTRNKSERENPLLKAWTKIFESELEKRYKNGKK